MASKTANVTARVQPEIKIQAESVLAQLGIPVSVLIDSLYRQIIMTQSIPYSLALPTLPTLDTMSQEEFDHMLETGVKQARQDQGASLEEAFQKIGEEL